MITWRLMHLFSKMLFAIAVTLVGTCVGIYKLAVRDFKSYREKRRNKIVISPKL